MLVMFGYHLEADLASFPIMAQSLDQSRGVRRARKRPEESSVTRLDHTGNSGEAALGQPPVGADCGRYLPDRRYRLFLGDGWAPRPMKDGNYCFAVAL